MCVKTEGCGVKTFIQKIVYSFRRRIAFLAYGNLMRRRKVKNFDISITDFIGFFTKNCCKQMAFYAMAILQRTVLVWYRYKNYLHLILIISILYRTHFIATYVQVSKTKFGNHRG